MKKIFLFSLCIVLFLFLNSSSVSAQFEGLGYDPDQDSTEFFLPGAGGGGLGGGLYPPGSGYSNPTGGSSPYSSYGGLGTTGYNLGNNQYFDLTSPLGNSFSPYFGNPDYSSGGDPYVLYGGTNPSGNSTAPGGDPSRTSGRGAPSGTGSTSNTTSPRSGFRGTSPPSSGSRSPGGRSSIPSSGLSGSAGRGGGAGGLGRSGGAGSSGGAPCAPGAAGYGSLFGGGGFGGGFGGGPFGGFYGIGVLPPGSASPCGPGSSSGSGGGGSGGAGSRSSGLGRSFAPPAVATPTPIKTSSEFGGLSKEAYDSLTQRKLDTDSGRRLTQDPNILGNIQKSGILQDYNSLVNSHQNNAVGLKSAFNSNMSSWASRADVSETDLKNYFASLYEDQLKRNNSYFGSNPAAINCRVNFYFADGNGCPSNLYPPSSGTSSTSNPAPIPTDTPTQTPEPTKAPEPTDAPTPAPNGEEIIRKVDEQEGSFLIQKINTDSVEGLWYEQYPVATNEGTPKTLYIGDDIGYACEGVSEKLTSIDFSAQTATFTKVVGQPPFGGCPRCLAGNTLIDTPLGLVPVKDLQIGMPIWTSDKSGNRVRGIVIKTSKVPVPPAHQMVHLVLADGRELFVSPGHPTADGRSVGNLAAGDSYDGTSIVNTQRVSYGESTTYDVLPSGITGFYWANGVLLGSTLSE